MSEDCGNAWPCSDRLWDNRLVYMSYSDSRETFREYIRMTRFSYLMLKRTLKETKEFVCTLVLKDKWEIVGRVSFNQCALLKLVKGALPEVIEQSN